MTPARPLENIYWADEGDTAVRWLIGHINYGQYDETRDKLRTAALSEVADWAAHTKNLHLFELVHAVTYGQDLGIQMNPDLGPNDRICSLAASVVLTGLASSSKVTPTSVEGDTASFIVDNQRNAVHVQVNPRIATAHRVDLPRRPVTWDTRLGGAAAHGNITGLLGALCRS